MEIPLQPRSTLVGGAQGTKNDDAGSLHRQVDGRHHHGAGGRSGAFSRPVRVRTEQDDRFYYPDLLVSCTRHEPSAYYTEAPVLIVQVPSQSTERHDRAEKFYHYRRLGSLQEYVLVAQDLMRVEVYRRSSGWDLELYGEGDRFCLEAVDLELAVEDCCTRFTGWGEHV